VLTPKRGGGRQLNMTRTIGAINLLKVSWIKIAGGILSGLFVGLTLPSCIQAAPTSANNTSLCNLSGERLRPGPITVHARFFSDGLEVAYLFDAGCANFHLPVYFRAPNRPRLDSAEQRPAEVYRVLLLSGEPVDTRHHNISGQFDGVLECNGHSPSECMLRVERIGDLDVNDSPS
jgi:hypothetical protein